MCEIVGYAGLASALKLDLLSSVRDTIAHPGPDASGLWSTSDGSVLLGRRRLAILDLFAAGPQPMENFSRTSAVVFTARFTTTSARGGVTVRPPIISCTLSSCSPHGCVDIVSRRYSPSPCTVRPARESIDRLAAAGSACARRWVR
jgi:hypothetical protein